jgi:hypothetical protein
MTNARINGLRSIELGVHDLQKSAEFYRRVWALEDVAAEGDTIICAAPAASIMSSPCTSGRARR